MPFTSKSGVNIHFELVGNPVMPPLVLTHGNGNCLDDWYHLGYVDRLKDRFHLILIDLRGFGESDKPREEAAYDPDLVARDVIAVLDEIGIEKAHYFGNSRGGSMAFLMGKRFPERFLSFIIGSAQPFGKDAPQLSDAFEDWLSKGIEHFVDMLELVLKIKLSDRHKGNFLRNSPDAMIAVSRVQINWPNDSDCFIGKSTPRMLTYGTLDELAAFNRKYKEEIDPGCDVIELADFTHADAYRNGDIISDKIIAFHNKYFPVEPGGTYVFNGEKPEDSSLGKDAEV